MPVSMAIMFEYGKGLGGAADDIEARLIVGSDFGAFSVVVNLIGSMSFIENNVPTMKMVLGMRRSMMGRATGSLEFDGVLAGTEAANLTPAINWSLRQGLDIRVGATIPLDFDFEAAIVRAMVIYEI